MKKKFKLGNNKKSARIDSEKEREVIKNEKH